LYLAVAVGVLRQDCVLIAGKPAIDPYYAYYMLIPPHFDYKKHLY
jgi:hypothetical protein